MRATTDSSPRDQVAGAQEAPRSRVHTYDFVRPTCLSKEQSRTLQLVHEAFAHKLAGVLSPPLRLPLHVTPAPVRETAYADFISELPEFAVSGIFRMSSEAGPALFAAGCDTALLMLDRLLGGTAATLPEPRWLTEIECTLMESVLGKILGAYAETWSALVETAAQVRAVSSSSMISHVALPADTVCVAQFSLEMGSATAAFSLCLPVIACEPMLVRLVLQHWLASGRAQVGVVEEFPDRQVTQVRVPVQVVLGGARVSLSRVARLSIGDIVRLDQGANDEAEIIVGGKTKFFGRPGKTDGHLAVQITREATPGEGMR